LKASKALGSCKFEILVQIELEMWKAIVAVATGKQVPSLRSVIFSDLFLGPYQTCRPLTKGFFFFLVRSLHMNLRCLSINTIDSKTGPEFSFISTETEDTVDNVWLLAGRPPTQTISKSITHEFGQVIVG
jgi:hypothetical protein